MKRKLLPLAVAAAMGVSGMAVAGEGVKGPTIYGKAKIGFGLYDSEDPSTSTSEDQFQLDSYASRVGVKGETQLSDSTKVFYKYEWEVDVDDTAKDLGARNRYAGLSFGNAGAIKFGHYDTPTKVSQGKVDLFGDFSADIAKDAVFKGDNRASNQINYTSPKFGDSVAFSVSIMPGEGSADTAGERQDGLVDSFSANVTFKQDNLYLAFATDADVMAKAADGEKYLSDITRLTGQFKGDGFSIGGIYEMADMEIAVGTEGESTMLLLSGKFGISDDVALKGQVATGEEEVGSASTDVSKFTFGADYKMGKKTTAQAYVSIFEREDVEERTELVVGLTHSF